MSDVSNLLLSTVSHKTSPYLCEAVFYPHTSHTQNLNLSVGCKLCTIHSHTSQSGSLLNVTNVPKLNTQPNLHLPVRIKQCSYPYSFSHNTSCNILISVSSVIIPILSHTKHLYLCVRLSFVIIPIVCLSPACVYIS